MNFIDSFAFGKEMFEIPLDVYYNDSKKLWTKIYKLPIDPEINITVHCNDGDVNCDGRKLFENI